MYYAQIAIPKISDNLKLYIYCSKNADSINTISKVRTLKPNLVIDESTAKTHEINGKQCYVVYDNPDMTQEGVEYIGLPENVIPVSEYQYDIHMVKLNDNTYLNQLELKELPLKYNGTILYYSVIGIDEANGTITHLSEVKSVLIKIDYKKEGTRHVYSSEDGKTWKYLEAVAWNEEIKIGDTTNPAELSRFGIPFVEGIPTFYKSEINVSLKPLSRNFVVLEIPNPWKKNNQQFNFRKLKSYKIQNVIGEQYGDFSEPSYQSLLPVSIEQMIIIRKTDQEDMSTIPFTTIEDDDTEIWKVIRNEGLYYNRKEHRRLGLNKYNISLGEKLAVFSEGSTQDYIKIQVESKPARQYLYSIYLMDIYGNISAPCDFLVNT